MGRSVPKLRPVSWIFTFIFSVLFGAITIAPAQGAPKRIVPVGDKEGVWTHYIKFLQANSVFEVDPTSGEIQLDERGHSNIKADVMLLNLGDLSDWGRHTMRVRHQALQFSEMRSDEFIVGNREANKTRFLYELFDDLNDPNREGGPYYRLAINGGKGFSRIAGLRDRDLKLELQHQQNYNLRILSWLKEKIALLKTMDTSSSPDQVEILLRQIAGDTGGDSAKFRLEEFVSDPVVRLAFLLEMEMGSAKDFQFRATELAEIRAGLVNFRDIQKFENVKSNEPAEVTRWRREKVQAVRVELKGLNGGQVLKSFIQDMIENVQVFDKRYGNQPSLTPNVEHPYIGDLARIQKRGKMIFVDPKFQVLAVHGYVTPEAASNFTWLPHFLDVRASNLDQHILKVAEMFQIKPGEVMTHPAASKQYLDLVRTHFGHIDPDLQQTTGFARGKLFVAKLNANYRRAMLKALAGEDPVDGITAYFHHRRHPAMLKYSLAVARSAQDDGMVAQIPRDVARILQELFPVSLLVTGHTPTMVVVIAVAKSFGENNQGRRDLVHIGVDQSASEVIATVDIQEGGEFLVEFPSLIASDSTKWSTSRHSPFLSQMGRRTAVMVDGLPTEGAIVNQSPDGHGLALSVNVKSNFKNSLSVMDLKACDLILRAGLAK